MTDIINPQEGSKPDLAAWKDGICPFMSGADFLPVGGPGGIQANVTKIALQVKFVPCQSENCQVWVKGSGCGMKTPGNV